MPPKGIRLDTDEMIATHASEIYIQAGAQPCHAAWQPHAYD